MLCIGCLSFFRFTKELFENMRYECTVEVPRSDTSPPFSGRQGWCSHGEDGDRRVGVQSQRMHFRPGHIRLPSLPDKSILAASNLESTSGDLPLACPPLLMERLKMDGGSSLQSPCVTHGRPEEESGRHCE